MKLLLTIRKPLVTPRISQCSITRITIFRNYSSTPTKKTDPLPKPTIRWFYASDVPISKPDWYNYEKSKEPESFIPFSDYDSKNLEHHFIKNRQDKIVEVNEDKLFQVDLQNFELSPVYWEGPVYEVRRGLWFNPDGIPLNAKVTEEIEKEYERLKPYLFEGETITNDQSNKLKKISNKGNKEKISQYFGPKPSSLLGVTHIQRGYSEELQESFFDKLPENPLPGISDAFKSEIGSIIGGISGSKDSQEGNDANPEQVNLQLGDDNEVDDLNMQKIFESDYDLQTSRSKSNREIDHLVLCIHGIGQVLGSKYESINFTHNINILRNTMKRVYQENDEYKKLAYNEEDSKTDTSNNRIQVLPISWRHRVGFNPQEKFDNDKPSRLPSLSQVNVEGISALRDVVGDVVLDVLLFYQPRYLNQIIAAVTSELNRVYQLYKERNPNFNGKVHIMGHSLGSAIAFDILSSQPETIPSNPDLEKMLTFDVENLFLVGSPVGMFKLLAEKNIQGRNSPDFTPSSEDQFDSPKCTNLYNIFHPCDPVAYRLEPLVVPQYGDYKPADIKFAVKGFNTQIKELASLGDELSEKISSAAKWLTSSKKTGKEKSVEEIANNENALGDIIKGILMDAHTQHEEEEKEAHHQHNSNTSSSGQNKIIVGKNLQKMIALNKAGRVDYSLPVGVLDFSLVSAVSAHVSYFEDQDTSGFIMNELLKGPKNPVDKIILTHK
ncbi:putative phospholipase C20G8.02, mitochondrial [Candida tropicalis]